MSFKFNFLLYFYLILSFINENGNTLTILIKNITCITSVINNTVVCRFIERVKPTNARALITSYQLTFNFSHD